MKDLTLPRPPCSPGCPRTRLALPVNHPDRALVRRNHVLDRMAEEKYVSREEAEEARSRRSACTSGRNRLDRALLPRGGPEVPGERVRQQRIYQGGLQVSRHSTPHAEGCGPRPARRAAHAGPPRPRVREADHDTARGWTAARALHLDEWDWPFAAGDVVRGVVIASDRATAVVQIGDYRARLSPPTWRGRGGRASPTSSPRGGGAIPDRLALRDRRRNEAVVRLEQEPKVDGRSSRSMCARCGPGDGRGYDFEKSKFNRATQAMRQVAPPSSRSSTPRRSRPSGGPVHDSRDAPLSYPNPWNRRSGRRRTTMARIGARSRSAAPWSRAATSPR